LRSWFGAPSRLERHIEVFTPGKAFAMRTHALSKRCRRIARPLNPDSRRASA
jgi:hypothetical protein